jgi:N-acetylglucosamine-6-phosphate deacetylase
MIALSGADVVVHDRVLSDNTILIEDGAIARIEPRRADHWRGVEAIDLSGHVVVPGFVDVHVHGLEGTDVLGGGDAVAQVAARLPKYGVTAFCPTSVACAPDRLASFLSSVAALQGSTPADSARVLGAHLESNFLNPDWNGAQPAACLRMPPRGGEARRSAGEFSGADILDVIRRFHRAVSIVTLAPELPGAIELIHALVAQGLRVSIGHTGATYEEARAAIDAGARHATHLFNRMSSIASRSPGVVGAVLESNAVTAEIICDGHHVHPSLVALAVRTKSISRVMAITDGTAAAGLPAGSRARLGDQTIVAGEHTALLDDGTLAGSILTMDGAFRMLIALGLTLPEAARMCASTPAEALGVHDIGSIAAGNRADLVVLDRNCQVKQTWLAGRLMSV